LMENNVFNLLEYYIFSIIGFYEHSAYKMPHTHMKEY
jgi:hypothetical protein